MKIKNFDPKVDTDNFQKIPKKPSSGNPPTNKERRKPSKPLRKIPLGK